MLNITVTGFRLKLYPRNFSVVRSFYKDDLGFKVLREWDRGADDQGVMFQFGTAILEILTPEKEYKPLAGIDLSLKVPDVTVLWEAMKDRTDIVFGLRHNEWGDSSFCITDPEGFEVTFFTADEAALSVPHRGMH